ncbi:MAG: KDO2-lipid IV(A) lauroyltransferase [Pelagibacterales bacterium]|nr:KDO2-lipid IV(A) lauroyltransferase [Pelagibacterales bacterium]
MKFIKYFFQATIVYAFFLIIKLIGLSRSRKLFAKIFNKIGPIIKSKDTINKNLEKLIGSYSDDKKNEIIFKMWANFGKLFVEYIYLHKFQKSHSHINVKGEKILEEIKKRGRPVIFVSGHFANFELMSMELTKRQINLATIYRPLNNIFLNPFMEYLRKKYICKHQIKKGLVGVKHSIEYLRKNFSVALMIDQRVSEGVKLPFFEYKAFTTTLPAQLALKHKYLIVPIYITRKQDDNFEMEIFEPLETTNKENTEKNKLEVSISLNKIIEKMILKDPSQWIWTHNRWK